MKRELPELLLNAISSGVWKNPGANVLRTILGLPEMQLFEDISRMECVASQLDSGGYVDDPEFCLVRTLDSTALSNDPRLIFDRALFIAGSNIPGDDVFVTLPLYDAKADPQLLIFDWDKAVPNRWAERGNLGEFIRQLTSLQP